MCTIYLPKFAANDSLTMSVSDVLDKWKNALKSDFIPVVYSDLQAFICSLRKDEVKDHLINVLPLSLRLLDHHHTPNRFLGLKCLDHVKECVPLLELKKHGMDMLLLHSLKNGLHVDSDEYLGELLPFQLRFLTDFKYESPVFDDHVDDVFDLMMKNMELTCKVGRKEVYWQNMSSYISLLGVNCVKYSKRIVSLLEDQLSFPVQDSVREMFVDVTRSTRSFIESAEPRIKGWQDKLLFILLKFAHSNLNYISNDELLRMELTGALDLLKKSDEKSFLAKIQFVDESAVNNPSVKNLLLLLTD